MSDGNPAPLPGCRDPKDDPDNPPEGDDPVNEELEGPGGPDDPNNDNDDGQDPDEEPPNLTAAITPLTQSIHEPPQEEPQSRVQEPDTFDSLDVTD
jgi:hypothetical protein